LTYVLSCDQTFRDTGLRLAGAHAALLYAVALHECAAIDGDGVLPPLLVKDAANLYDLRPGKLAPLLVQHGVWHDHATFGDCPDCPVYTESLNPGEFLIHKWWDPLLHKAGKDDPVKRSRELRRKRLWKDKKLVGAIRQRDHDLCRYCGVSCLDPSGPDKKHPEGLTLDHVDPWGENTQANVVVACRRCNGVKRDRTPDEAGMPLLKPGTRSGTDQTPAPDDRATGSNTDPAHARRAREAGTGLVGSGMDGQGSGPGVGSGRVPVPGGHSTNGDDG